MFFDFDTAHNLERFGGPKIVDAPAYLKACLIRAAYKMVSNPEAQCPTLQESARDSQFFGNHFAGEARLGILTTKPEGWDAQAFCFYAARAKASYPPHNFNRSLKSLGLAS